METGEASAAQEPATLPYTVAKIQGGLKEGERQRWPAKVL